MTVKQLKKLLKPLDNNMEVMMQLNSDSDIIVSVCKQFSEVQEVDFDGKVENVLFLVPCSCEVETDEIVVEQGLN